MNNSEVIKEINDLLTERFEFEIQRIDPCNLTIGISEELIYYTQYQIEFVDYTFLILGDSWIYDEDAKKPFIEMHDTLASIITDNDKLSWTLGEYFIKGVKIFQLNTREEGVSFFIFAKEIMLMKKLIKKY